MSDLILDDRVIQIIELTRKRSHCSLDYLSEILGVSTRTIRNDIKQLNSDLNGIATLENEKGKGYRLMIQDKPLFDDLVEKINSDKHLHDSPQNRIAFIIGRLVNTDHVSTLDELAFEMNIGRTTLVNELKKAAAALEAYHLSIRGKQNKGMYLSGNELDLRFFILDNIYDYLYREYPLDEDIKDAIIKVANQNDLESTTLKRLMQFVIVMLDRLLKNHSLTEVNKKLEKLLDTKDYRLAQEITKTIENHLPVTIPQSEILFITLPIAGRRTPTNNRSLVDITITDDVKHLLNLILEQVGFEQDIILENKDFFEDLQYHLT